MSHGPRMTMPTIYVYPNHRILGRLKRKLDEAKTLFLEHDVGTKEEREVVAEYVNNMLLPDFDPDDAEPSTQLGFAFWNHRPDQEIEEYDDLVRYWMEYGKIVAAITQNIVHVHADFWDYEMVCSGSSCHKVFSEGAIDMDDLIDTLRLKRKVSEGDEARKKLKSQKTDDEAKE